MKIIKLVVDKKPEYCLSCPISILHLCGKPVTEHPTSGSAVTYYRPDSKCMIREAGK